MPEKPLTKLRRARRCVVANLRRLEPLVAGYQAKLARLDAQIQELDPRLPLPPRHYKPNPVFARGELPRLVMAILREAKAPLPVGVIAVRALAMKGVERPGPGPRKLIRVRVSNLFWVWDRRGVTRKVGAGNGTRRGLI